VYDLDLDDVVELDELDELELDDVDDVDDLSLRLRLVSRAFPSPILPSPPSTTRFNLFSTLARSFDSTPSLRPSSSIVVPAAARAFARARSFADALVRETYVARAHAHSNVHTSRRRHF